MVRIHSTLQLKDIASGSGNSLCAGHLGHLLRITAVAIEDPQRLHSSQQKDTYKKQISVISAFVPSVPSAFQATVSLAVQDQDWNRKIFQAVLNAQTE